MSNPIEVHLWGQLVGALLWDDQQQLGFFEYAPAFLKFGLDIAPFRMPITSKVKVFSFKDLRRSPTFNGLPGLLADSLPDKFGNDILQAWLASRGLSGQALNPVVRLSYVGNRGMGALEFKPAGHSKLLNRSVPISIQEMSELVESILQNKKTLDVNLDHHDDKSNRTAINDIIRIGSSAGGAKPKAIIAMNEEGHVLSGQVDAPPGYKHWLIKFDIAGDFDRERNNGLPPASGRIEYAYYLMAKQAHIKMNTCRLLEVDGQGHFLTERFDRADNEKLHVQSFSAMEHFDRDHQHDYAQLIATARKLKLGMPVVHEVYRRMVFNALTYNFDDHTRNHAFMMDRQGSWSLTPAYDVTYAYDPAGKWTRQHQMSIFGKNDAVTVADLLAAAERSDILSRHALEIIEGVQLARSRWTEFAKEAKLDTRSTKIIDRLLSR